MNPSAYFTFVGDNNDFDSSELLSSLHFCSRYMETRRKEELCYIYWTAYRYFQKAFPYLRSVNTYHTGILRAPTSKSRLTQPKAAFREHSSTSFKTVDYTVNDDTEAALDDSYKTWKRSSDQFCPNKYVTKNSCEPGYITLTLISLLHEKKKSRNHNQASSSEKRDEIEIICKISSSKSMKETKI